MNQRLRGILNSGETSKEKAIHLFEYGECLCLRRDDAGLDELYELVVQLEGEGHPIARTEVALFDVLEYLSVMDDCLGAACDGGLDSEVAAYLQCYRLGVVNDVGSAEN